MPVTNPKQRATRPLDRFADQIAEVIAVSKRRAFILDLTGRLRYAEDGEECPSPIDITMPGMPLIVADPEVHRRLDAVEAAHTAAVHPAISAVAKQHGPAAERAMFWKGAGAAYHDFTRHGPVVIWRYGMNNAFNEKRRICRGVDEQAAIAFLADIRSKPPAGYRATSPFYVERRGCVVRTYAKASTRELRGVVGSAWRRFGGALVKRFASPARAVAAYEEYEHKRLAAGWAMIGIEVDRSSLSAADRAEKRR
ncbi:MAG: hypothetical protein IPO88_21110 [Nannocystis sp.]|uniref:hypothetical protein n=1 Tax=Nannocystis sp. TaxID=1962667 RepID=UPI0024225792|nr:hypothetical protein [Nannocystis sp.]MBK9755952.1 hypothetical protein [Nannocystis sp.]